MDFNTLIQSLQLSLGQQLPALLAAVGVGVAGWLIAIMVKAVARRMLGALKLDRRINDALAQGSQTSAYAGDKTADETTAKTASDGIRPTALPVVDTIAGGLYAVVLVLTAIAVLNALNLAGATAPLTGLATDVLAFMPNLLAALVLGAVAWLCAVLVRALVGRALTLSLIDVRLAAASGSKARTPLSRQLSQSAFWLTLLLFVPTILGALQLNGLLTPVQTMMSRLLDMVPNIFAGGLIGAAGYLLAKLLRALTVNLLEASGANRMATKLGLGEAIKVPKLAGTVVYVLILIPTLIAALDALKIESISAPAIAMLTRVMESVPAIFGAALILAIAYFAARIVARLATEFLAGAGIDQLPEKMGFSGAAQRFRVSVIVGKALMFFALLLAGAEAASRLGFARISEMSASLTRFGGNIILGALVLVIGAWLANLAHRAIQRNAPQGTSPVAGIVRIAILGFVLAMGLRAMGIAPEVVNISFALTFGAVAVAAALSFGLGGREAAGRHLEHWFSSWRQDSPIKPESPLTASKDTTELSPATKAGLPRRGRGSRSGPTAPL